jgi:hypothetical protein
MARMQAMARDWLNSTGMPSDKNGPSSQARIESGVRIETGVEPNSSRPPFCSTSATPSVRMSCA